MQHAIPVVELGPQGPAMAKAVDNCVHCGLCLAACPTYKMLGEEMDSPRGRILLMKEALEDELTTEEVLPYVDRCLGCMACVTACPSGVPYGDLLAPFRAHAEKTRRRPVMQSAARLLVHTTLPYPRRFRSAVRLGKLARVAKSLLPPALRPMLDMLPDRLPASATLPERIEAQGQRRARVALLTGCVQNVLAPEINWATARVLARNGVEVVIPRGQGCCGSLPLHTGEADQARDLARRNLRAFPHDVDAVITNAAGCGSGMHEYPLLFAGEADEDAAQAFAHKVMDISVFLHQLGIEPPPPLPQPVRVAYHDACHLAHAQRITAEPRSLLATVPNLKLVEIPEGDLCCGSAGTYNLEQPDIAHQLGERKAHNILAVEPQVIAAGNIGCIMQIRKHIRGQSQALPILHTITILDRAYAGLPLLSE